MLEVPQSSYYQWQRGEPSARARRDAEALPKVRRVFFDKRKAYGSPRIHLELVRAGEPIGRHRVARLMRQDGLDARPRRKARGFGTDSRHKRGFADNLLQRNFAIEAPNRVWAGDVKYIETTCRLKRLGARWLCVAQRRASSSTPTAAVSLRAVISARFSMPAGPSKA